MKIQLDSVIAGKQTVLQRHPRGHINNSGINRIDFSEEMANRVPDSQCLNMMVYNLEDFSASWGETGTTTCSSFSSICRSLPLRSSILWPPEPSGERLVSLLIWQMRKPSQRKLTWLAQGYIHSLRCIRWHFCYFLPIQCFSIWVQCTLLLIILNN